MSLLSTSIIDGIISFVETNINSGLSDTYVELPDPYAVEANPEIMTNKGFSVAFFEGNNASDVLGVSCKHAYQREINVAIYQQIYASDFDADTRTSQIKTMFTDWFRVLKAIDKDGTMSSVVQNTEYLNDSGIVYAEVGDIDPRRFFVLETSFLITYFEDLTT